MDREHGRACSPVLLAHRMHEVADSGSGKGGAELRTENPSSTCGVNNIAFGLMLA